MKNTAGLGMRIFKVSILILSVLWVAYLLHQVDWHQMASAFVPDSWYFLAISCFMVCISMFLYAVNFHQFLSVLNQKAVSLRLSLSLHFSSQLVRYMPGRFWGFAYQLSASRGKLPAATITRANIDMMILATVASFVIPVLVLVIESVIPVIWGLLVVVGSLAIIGICVRFLSEVDWHRKVNSWNLPSERIKKFIVALGAIRYRPAALARITFVHLISWCAYVVAWFMLARVFPVLEDANPIVLCALYSIAWIVGYVTAITPAGLGIRELTFYALAEPFASTEQIAFIVVFARVWLMAIEVLVFVVSLPFLYERESSNVERTSSL
ncbi:MAG: lysylphosphatidylglycerol synthase domain-containing protein [bacterium]